MIKVNLIHSKTAGAQSASGLSFGQASSRSSGNEIEAVKKIFVMCFLTILLWSYEYYNIENLTDISRKYSNEDANLKADVLRKRKVTEEAKIMQQQLKVIDNKIEIIKKLSKGRLREMKALDTLQTIIPEKAWFENLTYKDGSLEIKGFVLEDEDLGLFFRALEGRANFTRVILKKSQDKKTERGLIKEFFITCLVENVE